MFRAQTLLDSGDAVSSPCVLRRSTRKKQSLYVHAIFLHCAHQTLHSFAVSEDMHLSHLEPVGTCSSRSWNWCVRVVETRGQCRTISKSSFPRTHEAVDFGTSLTAPRHRTRTLPDKSKTMLTQDGWKKGITKNCVNSTGHISLSQTFVSWHRLSTGKPRKGIEEMI